MNEKERVKSLKRRYASSSTMSGPKRGPMGGHGPGGRGRGPAVKGTPKNTKATVRRIFSYLEEDKHLMAVAFLCVIIHTVTTLAGSYMLRPIINTYIAPVDGSRGDASGLLHALIVQTSLGAVNGYVEEMISGQKVVKVFCHEDVVKEEFDILNRDLRDNQIKAQFFGGVMGPVMGNLSQVNYALTACIGGLLCIFKNFDVGGLTVFLNFSRQFSRPINEISMQISNVFSALAGAERVFAVMDEQPEAEDDQDAVVLHPMKGHVTLDHVSFGYTPDKMILKDISLLP